MNIFWGTKVTEELKILKRIEELLRVIARAQVSSRLKERFADPEMRKLYGLTGRYTIRELEKKTGMSKSAISLIWKEWETEGLLLKEGKKYKKVF